MASQKKARNTDSSQGGDVIKVNNQGAHSAIAAGRNAKALISGADFAPELKTWQETMEKRIEAVEGLLPADKSDLKDSVAKVAEEVSKGKEADTGRLERLLNAIGSLAPDILDVAIATIASPLAGLGLVAKKIGDKAKLLQQTSS